MCSLLGRSSSPPSLPSIQASLFYVLYIGNSHIILAKTCSVDFLLLKSRTIPCEPRGLPRSYTFFMAGQPGSSVSGLISSLTGRTCQGLTTTEVLSNSKMLSISPYPNVLIFSLFFLTQMGSKPFVFQSLKPSVRYG